MSKKPRCDRSDDEVRKPVDFLKDLAIEANELRFQYAEDEGLTDQLEDEEVYHLFMQAMAFIELAHNSANLARIKQEKLEAGDEKERV